MRALFIIAVLWCLSCAGGYQSSVEEFGPTNGLSIPSLSYPIYLVPDHSFFLVCDKAVNASEKACRANRMMVVRAGAEQWQSYFNGHRLTIRVVLPEDLPAYTFNPPVYLAVDPNGCKDAYVPKGLFLLACYKANPSVRRIIFLADENITSRIAAHEIGHALGVDHTVRTNIDGSRPLMSEPIGSDRVTFLDIEQLCKVHLCPWDDNSTKGKLDEVIVSRITFAWSEMLP